VCGAKLNLQFHHLNPEDKLFCISDSPKMRCSLEKTKIEIAKCVLLCKECHEAVHNEKMELDKYLE